MIELSKSIFWKKDRKNISKCCLLKFLPKVLSIKMSMGRSYGVQICRIKMVFIICLMSGSHLFSKLHLMPNRTQLTLILLNNLISHTPF